MTIVRAIWQRIHKDPRGKSPFWYCAYRLPNGKRTFRSTKLKDRAAALKFCRGLEYASHESRAGRLTEARALELVVRDRRADDGGTVTELHG